MQYNGKLTGVLGLGLILLLGINFSGCEEKIPLPTLDIFITINGFTVEIAAEATNANTWHWDYGDGTVADSVGSHMHTYEAGGDYTITCTVTGDGGETIKTEEVHIATIKEMISGGAEAVNGKTWVLSRTPGANDGVGHVKTDLAPSVFPAVTNMLEFIGVPDEYDNEYTFYFDGSYSVDSKNGNILASWVYSNIMIDQTDWVTTTSYGIFQVAHPVPESATWSLVENNDLIIESTYDADIDYPQPGVPETVTFENVDYITFDGGGFIAMKDFTSKAIVREISPDRMTLTIFFNSYWGDPENDGGLNMRPCFIMTLSYDAKE